MHLHILQRRGNVALDDAQGEAFDDRCFADTRFAGKYGVVLATTREDVDDLADFPLQRYPHDFLLPRIWSLRNNLTAYDAAYVALAEALDAPLLTRDRRLAAAAGHHAQMILV